MTNQAESLDAGLCLPVIMLRMVRCCLPDIGSDWVAKKVGTCSWEPCRYCEPFFNVAS